jgi:hypothetical protein
MSDTTHKIYIFSLKSVGNLDRWLVSVFDLKKSWIQGPKRPEKENKKLKFYQAIRNQN